MGDMEDQTGRDSAESRFPPLAEPENLNPEPEPKLMDRLLIGGTGSTLAVALGVLVWLVLYSVTAILDTLFGVLEF